MKTAVTIAGSDSSGGAGIQADIKTMMAHKVYAMSAITALTAQNTTGVKQIMEVSPDFLAEELDSIFTDIRPDAVKTGMVSNPGLIRVIVEKLKYYQAEHIVVDPVMVATSGSKLLKDEALAIMEQELFLLAEVITPNIPEALVLLHEEGDAMAERLATVDAAQKEQVQQILEEMAEKLYQRYGCGVLLKGGHGIVDADDLLFDAAGPRWFYGEWIENPNTHGTGCTLSSAIASNLALGADLETAIEKAKWYISGALKDMMDLGKGSGPLNHAWNI